MNKKRWVGALIAVGVLAAAAVGLGLRQRFDGAINATGVDLSQPDAYVYTPALSRLPRDIAKAPIARDLLTEDFAFYYEEHEDRLGLRGAVKRIAFEHRTTLGDDLLAQVLDEPAELALWADAKGAPRHWLLAVTRGTVARALQQLATLAADDRQLSVVGQVGFNGSDATVYALSLSPRRTLGFVSQGNRVVVLSDPGLLFGDARKADPRSAKVVAQLLSGDAGEQGAYRRALGLGAPGTWHQLVAHARLLSFGYQHFFSGLQALRLDIAPGGGAVQTRLRVADAAALGSTQAGRALWQALPANPAACTLLPADWARVKAVVGDAPGRPDDAAGQAGQALADQLDGPAAICWYPRSQLHTPLVVFRTRDDRPATDAALESLSTWLFPAAAKPVDAAASGAGVRRWQREVAAPWGTQGEGDDAAYHASLARQGRWISFSPDAALVDLAVDAQARRYPSVADALPEQAAAIAVVAPRAVADLAQNEAFAVLPPEQALFRQAVEQHLVPRLDALRKLPAVQAVPRGAPDAGGWTSIDWLPLPAQPASAGK